MPESGVDVTGTPILMPDGSLADDEIEETMLELILGDASRPPIPVPPEDRLGPRL